MAAQTSSRPTPSPEDSAPPAVARVLVGTDRSVSADRAVHWAAEMAARYEAELWVVQVLPGESRAEDEVDGEDARRQTENDLRDLARRCAGDRGRHRILTAEDPAEAIVRAAEEVAADVIVLGNQGMSGRKEFLLQNVPNRVSHLARCNVTIVNTLVPASERTERRVPSEDDESRSPRRGRLAGRALRIGRVALRHKLGELLRLASDLDEEVLEDRARRLRLALEELGPFFAKVGQVLSTRPDLLPPAFIRELEKLQDQVPPMTEAEVVAVMEQELQVPWEDVFETLEPEPLAAGTIGQVHRATLTGGERVIVKVQRPTARDEILGDLDLLEVLARKVAPRWKGGKSLDLEGLLDQLAAGLRRELDFRREARNLEAARTALASLERVDVPHLYPEYSTARLLVMEEIQGVPMTEAPPGEARRAAARQLLEAFFLQIFHHGLFHADPHPGNLLWWRDRLYLIDWGLVGEVESESRELLTLLLLAFWQEDAPFLTRLILTLAAPGSGAVDEEALQEALRTLIERYRGATLEELRLGPLLQDVTSICVQHNLRLPISFAMIGKALAQVQLSATTLDSELDPLRTFGSFLSRNLVRRVRDRLSPQSLFYELRKLAHRSSALIEAFESVAGTRRGPGLRIRLHAVDRLRRTVTRVGGRLTLALLASAALVTAALVARDGGLPGLPWLTTALVALVAGISGVLAWDLVVGRDRGD